MQKKKKKREEGRKIAIAMIRRHARITVAWRDQTAKPVINKPMSGVRESLKHFKWVEGKCWGEENGETKTHYMYLHQACLSESLSDWGRLFPRWSPVGETVLPGQINWRASAHRPHRLMKRPRGYLQGHTKEVVWMLTENWALSRMPWVASNYCRPRLQGTITERGLPYYFFFFFFWYYLFHFFQEMRWLFTDYLHV